MSEHWRNGRDPTEGAINEVIKTLGSDGSHASPHAQAHMATETQSAPAPVNFDALARRAVLHERLFTPCPDPPNLTERERWYAPQRPLEVTYGIGTFAIEDGHDLPNSAVNIHRRLYMEGSNIILKPGLVAAFIEERLASGDVLEAAQTRDVIYRKFKPYQLVSGYEVNEQDEISFQVDVDRRRGDRKVYTHDEQMAGMQLASSNPELVIALASYNAIILDYLGRLQASLESQGLFDEQGRVEFDQYILNWTTSNFYHGFLPGMAIFLRLAKERHPGIPQEELIDNQFFSNVFKFGLVNGVFRNSRTVSEEHAEDGVAHEVKFRCPVAGVISDHLVDGGLLDRLHAMVRQKLLDNDDTAFEYGDHIREAIYSWELERLRREEQEREEAIKAAKPVVEIDITDMDLYDALAEAALQASRSNKPAVFSMEGIDYAINPGILGKDDAWLGQPEPGDHILDMGSGGKYRPAVIAWSVSHALRTDQAVSFIFNGESFRIAPEQAKTCFSGITL